jgi:hypothetical protein
MRDTGIMWISFHAVALMGFIYEIGLEVQYGVFIFGFWASGCIGIKMVCIRQAVK